MDEARRVLESLTTKYPPRGNIPDGPPPRHNITLNDEGNLEITLMLGNYYVPIVLEEEDLDRSASEISIAVSECAKSVLKDAGYE